MMSIRHVNDRAGAGVVALCALVSLLPIAAPAPAQAALTCTFTKSADVYEQGIGATPAAARSDANKDFVTADAAARARLTQWADAFVCPRPCGGKSSSIAASPNPPAEVVAPPVLTGASGAWQKGPIRYGIRAQYVDGFQETLTEVVACRLAYSGRYKHVTSPHATPAHSEVPEPH